MDITQIKLALLAALIQLIIALINRKKVRKSLMGTPIEGLGQWAKKFKFTASSLAKLLDGIVTGESTVRAWLKGGGIRDFDDVVGELRKKLTNKAALQALEDLINPPVATSPEPGTIAAALPPVPSVNFLEQQLEVYLKLEGIEADIRAKSNARLKNYRIRQKTRPDLNTVKACVAYDNQILWEELIPLYKDMRRILREHYHLLDGTTRVHQAELVEYLDIWDRSKANAIDGDTLLESDHREEKLYPLYKNIKFHSARLQKLLGRAVPDDLSQGTVNALLKDAALILRGSYLHDLVVEAQSHYASGGSAYLLDLTKAYIKALRYVLETAFEYNYNQELGSPRGKRLALRVIEPEFSKAALRAVNDSSDGKSSSSSRDTWKALVEELEHAMIGSCD